MRVRRKGHERGNAKVTVVVGRGFKRMGRTRREDLSVGGREGNWQHTRIRGEGRRGTNGTRGTVTRGEDGDGGG